MNPMDKILLDLDIEAARRVVPTMPDGTPMSDEGLLAGMHKARIHKTTLPLAAREASLAWLKAAGMRDVDGGPLPERIAQ